MDGRRQKMGCESARAKNTGKSRATLIVRTEGGRGKCVVLLPETLGRDERERKGGSLRHSLGIRRGREFVASFANLLISFRCFNTSAS